MAKYPTPEQIKTLLEGPADQPVVMLNLLKFNRKAEGDEGLTGAEAYGKYATEMKKFVESKGGRFLWLGSADSLVIGDTDEEFDAVGFVEYPSRKAFLEIASSEKVKEIGTDRSAGLEHQWLIACTSAGIGEIS